MHSPSCSGTALQPWPVFSTHLPLFGHIFSCNAHMIAAEYVSEPVTEYTVCQWFFPSLDSHPQVNQMRSFAYILPCLLQQCWSLLSLSIGLRDPRLSDLTCRSFGRCTLEQSRGFPHPRLACPTGFCPQPTAKMCPNMTSETSLGATAPFSGPL